MKNNFTLKLFCLNLLMLYVFTIQVEAPKELFQHIYFLQKLYPGTDSIQSLTVYKQKMTQYFFTLNKNMLFYSNNSLDKKVGDSIPLSKIVDKKRDNLKAGKCCTNLIFLNFASGIKSKKSKSSIGAKNPMLLELLKANYCLDIFIPNEARWRICSDKAKNISKLQLQIEYNILLSTTGKKNNSIIGIINLIEEKFLRNANTTPKPKSIDFRWEEQQKWEYRCQTNFMQSPISIKKEETSASQEPEFNLSYNFLDTFVKIEKRYGEAIIKFVNNPGLITLTKGGINIIYIPKYISFRFPGEHTILGKKYQGEMLIHCKEINPDKVLYFFNYKKRRISNGFIITIPLESNPKYSNLNTLESLNLDFWKYSLSKENVYIPKDFKTKAKKVFSFSNLMFILKKDQPNYYFYLGSKTIPPCDENVYHLVVSKPLKISGCQLKLIRENSLFTKSVKSIHARLTQPTKKRKVYSISNSNLIFRPNIESFVPQEFFDLAEEIDGEPLFPEKLSTISQIKAINATKKLIKKGGKLSKKFKYTKKGLKKIRKGLNIKKLAIKKLGKDALKIGKSSRKGGKGSKKGSRKGKTSKYAKNIIERGVSSGEYGTHGGHSHDSDSGSGSGSADDINC